MIKLHRFYLSLVVLVVALTQLSGQSVEIMPGTQQVFADVQWLRWFDDEKSLSLFSRTRATVDYSNQSDIFTGGYLNYTTSAGIGPTMVAIVGRNGAGIEGGAHYFTVSPEHVVFALVSVASADRFTLSWFSIARYLPEVSNTIRLYTSLELYARLQDFTSQVSVIRARAGISFSSYQVGLAINTVTLDPQFSTWSVNPGVFVRREF